MGFAEILNTNTLTAIRIEDGIWTRAKMQICDAEGKYRSPFGGSWVTDELWFCAECYGAYRAKLRQEAEKP